jgi:hypothetical protein
MSGEKEEKEPSLSIINKNMLFIEAKLNLILQNLPLNDLSSQGKKSLQDCWMENNERSKKSREDLNKSST